MKTFAPLVTLVLAILLAACSAAEETTTVLPPVPGWPADEYFLIRGPKATILAAGDFDPAAWEKAGWQVSETPATDSGNLPTDCTLRPLADTASTWAGACSGTIAIPRNGAEAIAVITPDFVIDLTNWEAFNPK